MQTLTFPWHFLECTKNMERLWVDQFCNLSKLTNVSTKEQNWTLLSSMNVRQCKYELALAKNDGVVDIVETPQLNLCEQARAQ